MCAMYVRGASACWDLLEIVFLGLYALNYAVHTIKILLD